MLKDGADPSRAINDIFVNGKKYATECATAIIIVYCKAFLEVFGKTLFNQQFPRIYLKDWISEPVMKDLIIERNVSEHLYGDGCYFKNPEYNPATSEWQGENVIALPKGMFYGHGIGIESANKIIHELNNRRKAGATISAFLENTVNRAYISRLFGIYSRPDRGAASLVWKPFPPPISSM